MTTQYIRSPVADLRSKPHPRVGSDKDRDQETQCLYGEKVQLLETNGDWVRVALPDQPRWTPTEGWHGYRGWIERRHLQADAPRSLADCVYARWENDFSWGTRGLRTQKIDLNALAEPMVGSRYLWGGRSGEGVDCSGLVHLLYGMQGICLPRNACDQARICTPVPLDDLRTGDLVFRKGARIDHVMLYIGEGRILEATEASMSVRRIPLSEAVGVLKGGRIAATW